MDLTYTPEQDEFRQGLRFWLQDNLPADWGGLYRGPNDEAAYAKFQRDWEMRLYRAGYAGVSWPKEYGGQGLSMIEQFIVSEELGSVAAPEGINFTGTELVGPLLLHVGTSEQRRRFIPRILSAEEVWCQGFSEPGAGSDLAAVKTTARRDGDEWVLNGQKLWTSNAVHSDWCLLLARTDPEAPKHRGLTMFIVPMAANGIDVRPLVQINGRGEFNEVFFDDVRVPLDHIIGPLNDGWLTANQVLSVERGTNRLYRQARFHHELRHLFRLAAKPRADGTVPSEDPFIRQRLAKAHINSMIHRAHNLRIVSYIANGVPMGNEVSMVKAFWGPARQELSTLALDIIGAGSAIEGEDAVEHGRFQDLYFTARSDTIYAGTVEIQRNIIAERLLGLPR